MAKRENCEHRHNNGNCLFNGGFCLANDEEHCVRINEIESYNQALEDLLAKVKDNHYLLSDKLNSTDYGMFTCGIEQAIDELKR